MTTPSLPQIPEVRSVAGVATLSLRAALTSSGRPAFFWNGRQIAPTIRVRPGDTIDLRYTNALPEYCGLGLVSDSNLHFHGLSLPPTVHSDDVVTTNVSPGQTFDYVLKIARNQPPGLYWYHPHPHGLANWEIGNGMSGAIVVEGIADELPQLAGLREQVMVLRDIPLDPSVAAAERLTALKVQPTSPPPPDPDEAGPPCGVESGAQTTINGLPSATIGIRPGERQLWRILNASGHRHYDLSIPGSKIELVAQDGIPLGYAPAAAATQTVDDVVVAPGARVEAIVTGPPHIEYLVSQCYDSGPNGDINPQAVLGELIDDGGTAQTPRVAAPFGLKKVAQYGTVGGPAVRRTIHFEEDAKGFYIDNAAYDPRKGPLVTARSGTLEEWTLSNETDEVHVFHIHQVHFIVETINGAAVRKRKWLDTVDVPPQQHAGSRPKPSTVTVLIDFRDPAMRGTFLFHCHILDHEDGGMMAQIRVI